MSEVSKPKRSPNTSGLPKSDLYTWDSWNGGVHMNADQFIAARQLLGLTIEELAAIANHKSEAAVLWESKVEYQPGRVRLPPAAVVKMVAWMLNGYRPPDWPERLRGE